MIVLTYPVIYGENIKYSKINARRLEIILNTSSVIDLTYSCKYYAINSEIVSFSWHLLYKKLIQIEGHQSECEEYVQKPKRADVISCKSKHHRKRNKSKNFTPQKVVVTKHAISSIGRLKQVLITKGRLKQDLITRVEGTLAIRQTSYLQGGHSLVYFANTCDNDLLKWAHLPWIIDYMRWYFKK